MRRWWRRWEKPQLGLLTPEAIQSAMPQNAHSVIVRFGQGEHLDGFYWQLRRHDHIKDLAIRTLRLTDRDQAMPLSASDVQAFIAAVDPTTLEALYLLQVPVLDIDRGVLSQLSDGAPVHSGKIVNLVMPAAVMFDFLANGASSDTLWSVSVGELLDGWPMKEAQTLATFLQQEPANAPQTFAPLPTATSITLADWQQADRQITALFDAPLQQVAATHDGTFVFTEVE